ncbi:Receptor expression-enhancing protein 5 [Paramecium bursaria]
MHIYIINIYIQKEIEKMWCCLISSYATLFYPLQKTYQSYQLGENQTLWTIYWIVSIYFCFIESFSFGLLFYIPGYETIKVLVLIWLYHSEYQGALLLGEKLSPILNILTKVISPFKPKLERFQVTQ